MAGYELKFKGSAPEGDDVHPQVRKVLDRLAAAPEAPPLSDESVALLRAGPNAIEEDYLPEQEGLTITNTAIEGVGVRVYQPESDKPLPLMIYIHGGCWVFCDLDTHDAICQYISKNSPCVVVSVDYPLSPDVKFPTGLESIYKVTKHLAAQPSEVNAAEGQLMVCGDSAGGNLSAALSMMARDKGEFEINYQILLYPITDITNFDTESYLKYPEGYLLSREMMMWSGALYVASDADRENLYVSPLVAQNLSDLPPALVLTAECDVLRDEAEVYAEKLAQAGVEVECTRYNGMIHAFVHMGGTVDMGREALDDVGEKIRAFFS